MNRFATTTLILVATGSIVGNFLLYNRYSSSRPILHVGNDIISKKNYQDNLEFLHGNQVLTKMVFDKIILQSAKKSNVLPSEQEIDKRISGIERIRPQIVESAQNDEENMRQIRESLRIQIALENLQIQGVPASEAEIAAFYAKNKGSLALPAQMESTIAVAKNAIQADSVAQMLRKNVGLATIARQPNIQVAGVNWQPDWPSFPAAARKQLTTGVRNLPEGAVRIVPISGGGRSSLYFIVRANRRRPGGTPALAQIKDQVARSLRLSKAPSAQDTIARLYKEANVTFDAEKYSSYFENVRRHAAGLKSPQTSPRPVASAR